MALGYAFFDPRRLWLESMPMATSVALWSASAGWLLPRLGATLPDARCTFQYSDSSWLARDNPVQLCEQRGCN